MKFADQYQARSGLALWILFFQDDGLFDLYRFGSGEWSSELRDIFAGFVETQGGEHRLSILEYRQEETDQLGFERSDVATVGLSWRLVLPEPHTVAVGEAPIAGPELSELESYTVRRLRELAIEVESLLFHSFWRSVQDGDAHITAFIRRWVAAERTAIESATFVEGLNAAVLHRPDVRSIVNAPAVLAAVAAIYAARGSLPEQRTPLYHEVIEQLVRRCGDRLAKWGGPAAVRRHFRTLAYETRFAQTRSSPSNTMDLRETVRLVAKCSTKGDEERAQELLDLFCFELELMRRQVVKVSFRQPILREFLVAETLAQKPAPARTLGNRAFDREWAEVVTMTAGVLAMRGDGPVHDYLKDLMRTNGPDPMERAARAGVGALCLAELEPWSLDTEMLRPVHEALDAVLSPLTDPAATTPLGTRIALAQGLGLVRDPRLCPPEHEMRWIDIQAGEYFAGAAPGDPDACEDELPGEGRDRWVEVPDLRLGRWPVTVGEYLRFRDDGGYADKSWWSPEGWAWRCGTGGAARPSEWAGHHDPHNWPVANVSYWEAEAYCAYLTVRVGELLPPGWEVRLPDEAEWEKAARGGRRLSTGRANPNPQRIYPWGDDWDSRRAHGGGNREAEGPAPVGLYLGSHSPDGLWDLAGNVLEWVRRPHPSLPELVSAADLATGVRLVRGGCFGHPARMLRVSYRSRSMAGQRCRSVGFRPAAAALEPRPR